MHCTHRHYTFGGSGDRNSFETRAQNDATGPKHARVRFSRRHAKNCYGFIPSPDWAPGDLLLVLDATSAEGKGMAVSNMGRYMDAYCVPEHVKVVPTPSPPRRGPGRPIAQ